MILIKILPAVLLAIIAAAIPLVTGWMAISVLKEFEPSIAILWLAYLGYIFIGLAIVTLFAEIVESRYKMIVREMYDTRMWDTYQP